MDETPIQKVLGRLHGVKPAGRDQWMALCPAHEDTTPSLKVSKAADDVVLVHCYTGCEGDAVLAAIDLTWADLYPNTDTFSPNGRSAAIRGRGDVKGPRVGKDQFDDDGSRTGPNNASEKSSKGPPVAKYLYVYANGDPAFRVLRYEPKDFDQERPDGSGGWINNLKGVERVPYRLPEILAAGPDEWIFHCEGEKDADTIAGLGLVATSFMGGAARKNLSDPELEPFRGKRVALLYDNDTAGLSRKDTVLRALDGIAADIRVLDLPSLPPKGDVSDWIALGHTRDELLSLANAPDPTVTRPLVYRVSDVAPQDIEWIWQDRLARGKIAILEGDPGLGKSTLTIDIAARLSRGAPLPDGSNGPVVGSLFMSAEDGMADTIRPRLEAAGADMSRVFVLTGMHRPNGDPGVTIPNDIDWIESVLREYDLGMVVIDPLSAYWSDSVSENKNQDVRRALAPLTAMLERNRVAAWCLRHLTKAQSATAVYRGAGSIGLGGAARIVLMVAEDPDAEGVRVLAGVKENLSSRGMSLSFKVVSWPVNPKISMIEWQGASTWTAKDLQDPPSDDLGPKLNDAVDWLRDYLRGGVIVMVNQMKKDAEKAGIKEITLKRARKVLKVEPQKDGAGAWGAGLPKQAPGVFGPDPVQGDHRQGDHEGESGARVRDDLLDPLLEEEEKDVYTTQTHTCVYDIVTDPLNDPVQEDHDPLPNLLSTPSEGGQKDQGDQGIEEEPW